MPSAWMLKTIEYRNKMKSFMNRLETKYPSIETRVTQL